MNKKNILTAAGIVLSFAIAIGGWGLTSRLIEKKSDRLLSGTLAVATNILDAMPASTAPEVPDGAEGDFSPVNPDLSGGEIVSILSNWDSAGRETPHEPTKGQLDMEQAIEAGRAWLSFIGKLNIFPGSSLDFNNAKAYLFQNLPPDQAGRFLPPAYSCWAVAFTGEAMSASLAINAVTGQVWKTEINTFYVDITPDADVRNSDIISALDAFSSYLHLNLDEVGESVIIPADLPVGAPGAFAVAQYFADGGGSAEAMATGWQLTDGRWAVSSFKIGLEAHGK